MSVKTKRLAQRAVFHEDVAFQFTPLTIRVQLIRVESQSAVVFIIGDAIIIIIIITSISFPILVVISLIGIGNVGAVVQIVLMAVFINVLVAVTFISHTIRVCVKLLKRMP